MECRYCKGTKLIKFLDLGQQALANDYAKNGMMGQYHLPLKVAFCEKCGLVQVIDYEAPENIFNEEYKYYSSYSTSWLNHCEKYVDMIVKRNNLTAASNIIEIASNDGYLLQYFKKYNIDPLGIEPSASVAEIARSKGIKTDINFFTKEYAIKNIKQKADLIIGNNVLAHVPDIRNFVAGLKIALEKNGTITLEFPSLMEMLKNNYFDTIYHEHFSYLSLYFLKRLFENEGLKVYDVELLHTHGGSLRIYVTHFENSIKVQKSVEKLLQHEYEYGIADKMTYIRFGEHAKQTKYEIVKALLEIKQKGKRIVGYGAAAKGNTLFNYVGIDADYIDYVVDKSPYKQGSYLPGSLIEICNIDRIKQDKPDYIIIIPWNLKKEIEKELDFVKEWGTKFITLLPEIVVW